MTRTEAATAAPAVRPRQRAICCRPNTRGKGQLSFRNEARRKARQPEVQQLLLLGGGRGTAGPACSSHAPNTPAQLPLMGYQQWLPWLKKATRALGEQSATTRSSRTTGGASPGVPTISVTPFSLCKFSWTDGAFQRQKLPLRLSLTP